MGIGPNHCQFRGAPRMTLLHLHHHHLLDLLYNKTIQFHLHYHHLFNQPNGLEHLYCMVRLRPCQILLWPPHQLLMTLRPVSIGLSRGSGLCPLHVLDEVMGWDGYDDLPVVALPVEFRKPDIERYTGIGCPRIHLQLYNTVMGGHRLDEA